MSGLIKIYNALEESRIDLLNKIKPLSEEELNSKPAEGKWSILQIIFHVVKTEKIAVISIRKYLTANDKVYISGLKAFAKFNVLLAALKSPAKFKSPPIVAKVPDTYNFNELLKQWETVRKSLKELSDDFPEEQKQLRVFTHPYSGDLKMTHTYSFLLEHFKHHRRQIEKINKNRLTGLK